MPTLIRWTLYLAEKLAEKNPIALYHIVRAKEALERKPDAELLPGVAPPNLASSLAVRKPVRMALHRAFRARRSKIRI